MVLAELGSRITAALRSTGSKIIIGEFFGAFSSLVISLLESAI